MAGPKHQGNRGSRKMLGVHGGNRNGSERGLGLDSRMHGDKMSAPRVAPVQVTCHDCVHLYRIQTGHGYEPEVQVPRCGKAYAAMLQGLILVPSFVARCRRYFEPIEQTGEKSERNQGTH